MKQQKRLEKMDKRLRRLKGRYFKISNTLKELWDDLYYLHEDISDLILESEKKELKQKKINKNGKKR
jgi:hypothetical protein